MLHYIYDIPFLVALFDSDGSLSGNEGFQLYKGDYEATGLSTSGILFYIFIGLAIIITPILLISISKLLWGLYQYTWTKYNECTEIANDVIACGETTLANIETTISSYGGVSKKTAFVSEACKPYLDKLDRIIFPSQNNVPVSNNPYRTTKQDVTFPSQGVDSITSILNNIFSNTTIQVGLLGDIAEWTNKSLAKYEEFRSKKAKFKTLMNQYYYLFFAFRLNGKEAVEIEELSAKVNSKYSEMLAEFNRMLRNGLESKGNNDQQISGNNNQQKSVEDK